MLKLVSIVACVAAAAPFFGAVNAQESHTVHFVNNCGSGKPTLVSQQGQILSTGADFKSNGPLIGAIAYLQKGNCGLNGEGCTLIETTLKNGASSTDISLIPPHTFSVTSGFGYFNGCDGKGADCTSAGCTTAFHVPTDTQVQVGCAANNGDLSITFCD